MKRKVREDFNPEMEYNVNVTGCSEDVKKEVQQAFFDIGISWIARGEVYQHFDKVQYTNTTGMGKVTTDLMYGGETNDCNMSAEEFLELVYEPKGHVHAELMARYAEDAKSHAEPWKLWQIKMESFDWIDCQFSPGWDPTCEFRRKPKTHFVHGVEIPDLRFTPKYGEYYYLADPTERDFTYRYLFHGDGQDSLWSERGLAYQPTEEGKQASILHSKALLGMSESTQE